VAKDRTDLMQGTLELLILKTLERESLHGYGIVQRIHETVEDLLKVEDGSLYPALQRMLKAGWVAAEWGVSARNREVRVYRLTPAGRKQLEKKVSAFDRLLSGITKVMRPRES